MNCHAKNVIEALDKALYYPQDQGVDGLCFNLYAEEFDQILRDKLVKEDKKKNIIKACWGKKSGYSVDMEYKLNPNYAHAYDLIKNQYLKKIELVIPQKFVDSLRDYQLDIKSIGTNEYQVTAVASNPLEINEQIIMIRNFVPYKIISRQPVGTISINLVWFKPKWSKGKNVLKQMKIDAYEGVQNIKTEFNLNYQLFGTIGLLKSLRVNSEQSLFDQSQVASTTRLSRKSDYIITFDNYEIRTK
jgi:hypothetical protein